MQCGRLCEGGPGNRIARQWQPADPDGAGNPGCARGGATLFATRWQMTVPRGPADRETPPAETSRPAAHAAVCSRRRVDRPACPHTTKAPSGRAGGWVGTARGRFASAATQPDRCSKYRRRRGGLPRRACRATPPGYLGKAPYQRRGAAALGARVAKGRGRPRACRGDCGLVAVGDAGTMPRASQAATASRSGKSTAPSARGEARPRAGKRDMAVIRTPARVRPVPDTATSCPLGDRDARACARRRRPEAFAPATQAAPTVMLGGAPPRVT